MRHRPEPRGFAAQVWTSMPADQAGGEWFETVQAAQPVLWGPVIRGRRPCAHRAGVSTQARSIAPIAQRKSSGLLIRVSGYRNSLGARDGSSDQRAGLWE